MMVRGDQYKMAICNKTGCIAAYNEKKNVFFQLKIDMEPKICFCSYVPKMLFTCVKTCLNKFRHVTYDAHAH